MIRHGKMGRMKAQALAIVLGPLLFALAASGGAPAVGAEAQAAPGGIWKAVVPKTPMHGEFGNLDPLGVAAGAKILADCSINWVNPDDGARYCFSSGTSLEYFLDRPHYNIERARAGWRRLNRH
jgi:hypothetical protein